MANASIIFFGFPPGRGVIENVDFLEKKYGVTSSSITIEDDSHYSIDFFSKEENLSSKNFRKFCSDIVARKFSFLFLPKELFLFLKEKPNEWFGCFRIILKESGTQIFTISETKKPEKVEEKIEKGKIEKVDF